LDDHDRRVAHRSLVLKNGSPLSAHQPGEVAQGRDEQHPSAIVSLQPPRAIGDMHAVTNDQVCSSIGRTLRDA